jgi:WD40 repeat protein
MPIQYNINLIPDNLKISASIYQNINECKFLFFDDRKIKIMNIIGKILREYEFPLFSQILDVFLSGSLHIMIVVCCNRIVLFDLKSQSVGNEIEICISIEKHFSVIYNDTSHYVVAFDSYFVYVFDIVKQILKYKIYNKEYVISTNISSNGSILMRIEKPNIICVYNLNLNNNETVDLSDKQILKKNPDMYQYCTLKGVVAINDYTFIAYEPNYHHVYELNIVDFTINIVSLEPKPSICSHLIAKYNNNYVVTVCDKKSEFSCQKTGNVITICYSQYAKSRWFMQNKYVYFVYIKYDKGIIYIVNLQTLDWIDIIIHTGICYRDGIIKFELINHKKSIHLCI